jgi:aminopeptidase N
MAIALRLYDLDTQLGSLPARVIMESTVVHEVAHQWFYSTVGNDQLDEPWLDESLAQYATFLYYRERYGMAGATGFRASLESRWERVDREPIPIGLPVADYSQQEYGAIVYGRGPLFLEALADEMGQATFDDFLRDYYQTQKWDIATTQRFKALAESHCDCDLTPLFEEWVFE